MPFRHNKKRNVALVYEFLVRRMTSEVLSSDALKVQETLGIIKKYFTEGSPLARERELFESIRGTRGAKEETARRILAQMRSHARKFDARVLEIKKSNLIKEINYKYGRKFFQEHRVPEYRLFASIQMVIDGCRQNSRLSEDVERIRLEENLVQFMISKDLVLPSFQSEQRVDAVVLSLVEKKFQECYGSVLSNVQRSLLECYVRCSTSGDYKELDSRIVTETKRITETLEKNRDTKEVREDAVMKERLGEVFKRLASLPTSPEEKVQELLLFQKLCEEFDSHE